MSDKKLAVLGIIAVLVAGAAVLQHRMSQNVHSVDFSSAPLIEGLAIDAVAAIQITADQGSSTVKLARSGNGFVVSDKDNYPADVTKINTLINQCLDIRTVDKITSNPDNHADLKVTEETARNTIAFLGAEDQPIVTLAMSETDEENNTARARLLSENDVYSIQSPPWFNTRPIDYIDTELLTVARDTISSVAVKTADSSYVLTSPEGSSDIHLEKMPDGRQFKGTDYQTVFGALSSLRFEDVSAAAKAPQDLAFDSTYNCKLYDLTVYKLSVAKKDDKAYVKVVADYLDKSPVEKTMGQVESDDELKKKEAKLLAIDAVKAFNARHKDWVYQIPSYKADQLIKPLSDLLEDVPAQPADPNTVDVSQDTASES